MLINTDELNRLLELLDQEHKTFRTVSDNFIETFPPERKFDFLAVLILLITNNAPEASSIQGSTEAKYLKLHQRLHGFFIVHDLHSNLPIEENPFMPFLVSTVQNNPLNDSKISIESQIESYFCIKLLFRLDLECLPLFTPSIFIANFLSNSPRAADLPDIKTLSDLLPNILPTKLTPLRCQGIHPCIRQGSIFQPLRHRRPGNQISRFISELNLKQELTLHCFELEFAREPPPLYPVEQHHLEWIFPEIPLDLLWDDSMVATIDGDEVENLIAVALQQQISEKEEERLLQDITHLETEGSDVVSKYGLTPEQLPDLIKYNPNVAFECLLSLCKTSAITSFYQTLATMDMSVTQVGLHSMEVINRLTNVVEMPKEFLHLYIANCIRSCESITDPFFQTRLVRLVCVFLQSLIHNKIIDIGEVFIEVQAFCIEFSRIREAAGLFKLLRSLQQSTDQDDKRIKLQF